MRRFPTTLVLVLLAVVAVVGGVMIFAKSMGDRYQAVHAVREQRSVLRFSETVTHDKGPLSREEWHLDNVDGVSSATYTAQNRAGTQIAKFTEPVKGYDVTFAFEALVRDGIWELHTRPLRGKTDDVYAIAVAQTAGARSGSHRFMFSDPHYLATTAGREYEIHLDKNKPVPDLVTLNSTSTADQRYQKMLDDFASFGPPHFKQTVAAARERLLKP